ncbi:MAG: ArsB/NhaD family transporter [Phycisphaerales bacterium]|nr:ArsB/NhaD family transporter [Phycisphaerales bacterium]
MTLASVGAEVVEHVATPLDQLIVLLIFVSVFAGIIFDKIDKAIVSLAGGAVVVLAGYLTFERAIHYVDFETIGLLLGMMLLVACVQEVHVFEWIALKMAIASRGSPVLILVAFGTATAVFSAFLDNVTTVLIMIPLVISITRGIGLNPVPFLLACVFLSNIGGAATLIGDPPNILIGTRVPELTFGSFLEYMTVPVLISGALGLLYLKWANRGIRSRTRDFPWLFASNLMLEQIRRQERELHVPASVMIRAGGVMAIVIGAFLAHTWLHLSVAMVAIAGAILMLLVFGRRVDFHQVVHHVEWPTLLFFSGLFVVVGAMEEVGILERVALWMVSITDNTLVLIMLILWGSAILSGMVDNIPFVAVMIPVLQRMMKSEPLVSDGSSHLLWWALVMGACFGGNATMIGASANVVGCAIGRSRGVVINFGAFARTAIPVTLITLIVSSVYLGVLYAMHASGVE